MKGTILHLNWATFAYTSCLKYLLDDVGFDSSEEEDIGYRYVEIPKLGLCGPSTNIKSFRPILNRSEHF